jgi:hypothetical protein
LQDSSDRKLPPKDPETTSRSLLVSSSRRWRQAPTLIQKITFLILRLASAHEIRRRRVVGSHLGTVVMLDNRKEGNEMYITDLVWWAYTAFIAAAALFLLYFAYKVREKGD